VTKNVTRWRAALFHNFMIRGHTRGGTGLASGPLRLRAAQVTEMQSEVIALLFPDPGQALEGPASLVTALVRDAEGFMELRKLHPDKLLLRKARLAGRFNCGKPILDPQTREVIGYEIEPMSVR
jgi:hypothetical protein